MGPSTYQLKWVIFKIVASAFGKTNDGCKIALSLFAYASTIMVLSAIFRVHYHRPMTGTIFSLWRFACKYVHCTVCLIAIALFGHTSLQAQSPVIARGAVLVKVASGFEFTEGPAVDSKGDVYFTDQPNDRIHKWSAADGTVTLFKEGTGRSNGLYFDFNGQLVACADQDNELWRIDSRGVVKVLVSNFEGLKLNGPNDLWIDRQGGIYFTDPFYKRDYWTRTEKEIEDERVYYFTPDGRLTIAAEGFVRPNGIVGSRKGDRLFVADIGDRKTYVYRVAKDGTLSDRKLFAEMGSDGMTLDHKGNLYLTGRGVTAFDKKGTQIEQIDVPERWTANVCFGGKDRKTLFITAMGAVYTLQMKVKGI